MSKDIPELSEREVVQMMAAQKVIMDNHDQLEEDYKHEIRRLAVQYDVEVNL